MGHKGHYGEYTGNAKWSKNHADTRVTKSNYKASERDDAAHIDYLKRDIDYDNKHGHSDKNMTADEKHISKLAGDMKYDKKHHSPAKNKVEGMSHEELAKFSQDRPAPASGKTGYERHMEMHNSPNKMMGDRKEHKMSNSEYEAHLQSPRGKQEHGSPAKQKGNRGDHSTMTDGEYSRHLETPRGKQEHGSPTQKKGLWANIHAKRKRGESPAQPGDKNYPTEKALKDSQ
jgi:hypothetical protein